MLAELPFEKLGDSEEAIADALAKMLRAYLDLNGIERSRTSEIIKPGETIYWLEDPLDYPFLREHGCSMYHWEHPASTPDCAVVGFSRYGRGDQYHYEGRLWTFRVGDEMLRKPPAEAVVPASILENRCSEPATTI
jgi:hypothetical protein